MLISSPALITSAAIAPLCIPLLYLAAGLGLCPIFAFSHASFSLRPLPVLPLLLRVAQWCVSFPRLRSPPCSLRSPLRPRAVWLVFVVVVCFPSSQAGCLLPLASLHSAVFLCRFLCIRHWLFVNCSSVCLLSISPLGLCLLFCALPGFVAALALLLHVFVSHSILRCLSAKCLSLVAPSPSYAHASLHVCVWRIVFFRILVIRLVSRVPFPSVLSRRLFSCLLSFALFLSRLLSPQLHTSLCPISHACCVVALASELISLASGSAAFFASGGSLVLVCPPSRSCRPCCSTLLRGRSRRFSAPLCLRLCGIRPPRPRLLAF